MQFLISFFLLFLTISCLHTAKGPQFTDVPVAPNEAILYVYRPLLRLNAASAPSVTLNGERRFSLNNAGYRHFILKPGQYTIQVKSLDDAPSAKLELSAVGGKKYFLKYDMVGESHLYMVEVAQGLEEIKETRAVDFTDAM